MDRQMKREVTAEQGNGPESNDYKSKEAEKNQPILISAVKEAGGGDGGGAVKSKLIRYRFGV